MKLKLANKAEKHSWTPLWDRGIHFLQLRIWRWRSGNRHHDSLTHLIMLLVHIQPFKTISVLRTVMLFVCLALKSHLTHKSSASKQEETFSHFPFSLVIIPR